MTCTDLAKSSRENKFKDKRSPPGLSYVLKKSFLQREFFCDDIVICKWFFLKCDGSKIGKISLGLGFWRLHRANRLPTSKVQRDNFLTEQAILKRRVVFLWNLYICDLRISLKITKVNFHKMCSDFQPECNIHANELLLNSFVTIYLTLISEMNSREPD